jgi:hypothetical protein
VRIGLQMMEDDNKLIVGNEEVYIIWSQWHNSLAFFLQYFFLVSCWEKFYILVCYVFVRKLLSFSIKSKKYVVRYQFWLQNKSNDENLFLKMGENEVLTTHVSFMVPYELMISLNCDKLSLQIVSIHNRLYWWNI